MSTMPDNNDIRALHKKLKTRQATLIILAPLGCVLIIGAIRLLQLEGAAPFGLLFALLGVVTIIASALLYKSYRSLQQTVNRQIHNDSDAAHTYQKADTFEKKKQLRYYPFMLLLALLCLVYLILFGATVSPYYYLILLILFTVGLIRYFNDKKRINKKIQENEWEQEEKASFALEKKQDTRTAGRIIGIVLAVAFVIFIIVSIMTSKPSNPYEDVFDKDPNTWSDEEKEYVDDFFDWVDNNK